MAAPTVTCSICGQTVNKRQTIAVGDNKRACRTHSEAASAAQTVQEQRKAEEEKGRTRKPFRIAKEEQQLDLSPKCWNCNKKGMRHPDFVYEMMLLRAKHEAVYQETVPLLAFNEEQAEKVRNALKPLIGVECLWYVKYIPEKHVFLKPELQMLANLAGVFLLCQKCCNAFKVERYNAAEEHNLSLEQLLTIGCLISEDIKQQALQEIAENN